MKSWNQWVCSGAWGYAFLTSSQVIPTLLVHTLNNITLVFLTLTFPFAHFQPSVIQRNKICQGTGLFTFMVVFLLPGSGAATPQPHVQSRHQWFIVAILKAKSGWNLKTFLNTAWTRQLLTNPSREETVSPGSNKSPKMIILNLTTD